MGFFSFIAQDTNRTVYIADYGPKQTRTYYLKDNKGNTWKETQYEGYGVFGGMDFYLLVAIMNKNILNVDIDYSTVVSLGEDAVEELDDIRDMAIDLCDKPVPEAVFPNISESRSWEWRNELPKNCPNQGMFKD